MDGDGRLSVFGFYLSYRAAFSLLSISSSIIIPDRKNLLLSRRETADLRPDR